jgi:hypothetical protein
MSGVIAAMEGDRERALLAIKKIENANMGPIGLNYIGYVYHALGDLDSYFEYINRAFDAHVLILHFSTTRPSLPRQEVTTDTGSWWRGFGSSMM